MISDLRNLLRFSGSSHTCAFVCSFVWHLKGTHFLSLWNVKSCISNLWWLIVLLIFSSPLLIFFDLAARGVLVSHCDCHLGKFSPGF